MLKLSQILSKLDKDTQRKVCEIISKMDEKEKAAKWGKVIKRFPSKSNPGKSYEVRKKGNKYSCNCKGWIFNKHCSHTDALSGKSKMAAHIKASGFNVVIDEGITPQERQDINNEANQILQIIKNKAKKFKKEQKALFIELIKDKVEIAQAIFKTHVNNKAR